MANQRHVDILLRDGLRIWDLWRKEEPKIKPDLTEADLSKADLSKADLSWADLRGANLTKTDLTRAILSWSDLDGAKLQDATLEYAILRRTNLWRADLRNANLWGADLHEADLVDADLREANLTNADLHDANLMRADLREASLIQTVLRDADLREANLGLAILGAADLRRANLSQAALVGASCIRSNLSRANLAGCKVYGISVWDVNLEGAIQSNLLITSDDAQSAITVDNLEVAQFLYLLLHNENVRAVLDTVTSKIVLILGRFGRRKPNLDALREALRSHPSGYIPVLFDFQPQAEKPVLETVKILANLARFIIADLTDPNMVRSELSYVTANVPTVPVQPLIEEGADLPTEYESWVLYRSFLPVYRYTDQEQLLANLTDAVIAPAERHVVARHLTDADHL